MRSVKGEGEDFIDVDAKKALVYPLFLLIIILSVSFSGNCQKFENSQKLAKVVEQFRRCLRRQQNFRSRRITKISGACG